MARKKVSSKKMPVKSKKVAAKKAVKKKISVKKKTVKRPVVRKVNKLPEMQAISVPNDPLAWMNMPDEAACDGVEVPDDSTVEEAFNDVVDTPLPKEECHESNDGFGFFEETEKMTSSEVVNEDESGFGFFEKTESEKVDENIDGFGFFGDDSDNDSNVIDLGSTLTIKNSDKWWDELKDIVAKNEPISLNAEYLDQVDGCGLQLLCAFFNAANEKSLDVTWGSMSDKFKESAAIYGVDEKIQLTKKNETA